MTEEERKREKELKYMIYLENEIIKQAKKRLKNCYIELENLGNNKDNPKTLSKKRNFSRDEER